MILNYLFCIHDNYVGVYSIQVALLSEVATVEFDECQTDTEKLAKDISSLGFDVELIGISTKAEFSTVKFKVRICCFFVLESCFPVLIYLCIQNMYIIGKQSKPVCVVVQCV